MTFTTHVDYRKIDYDQLINKPIIRTSANVNTLVDAGVYDKGDGKRYIVSVDGQNITQVIEEKDGYQIRSSANGGTTWGEWTTVQFADDDKKWDKVIISGTEPVEKIETTAWIDTANDNAFKVYDGSDWIEVSAQSEAEIVYITQANYDLLTPEEKADANKHYIIYEVGTTPSGIDAEDVSYDNTTSGATATNVQDALDEVFQSVSNGKELIADAITDKGVSTSATDSFQTMADNIRNIKTATSMTYDLLYPTSEQGFRFFVRTKSDGNPAYVDKKNILGKDVYMLSALGYNSSTDYGDIKILIIEEDGNVVEKTKHVTYRESGVYNVSLKYYPTSNTIAVVDSRGYAFYSIDFDTYAAEGVSGNYDDTYLNDIQHNGSIDFVQSTGERNGTIYASMLPVSTDGPIKVINNNVGYVPAFESHIESLFFTAPYTGNYHITGKAYNTNNNGSTEISLTGGTLVEGVSDIKVDNIGEGDIDCIYNVTLGSNVYIKNLKRSYGAGYGDSFTVEFVS